MITPEPVEDDLELVFIAAKLQEARTVEAILEESAIEYEVRVEQYKSGVVFASVRAGAFFYVLPEAAPACREVLRQRGYRVHEAG
jgi:hypothetical protein